MVPVGESEKILTQLKAYARALALETGSKATWAAGSLTTRVLGGRPISPLRQSTAVHVDLTSVPVGLPAVKGFVCEFADG